MTGDGQSEQNLRENPGGPPRINERNLSVESEYEYGSRVGFWRLFKLFNSFKYKFTLFGVGQALEQNPEAAVRCVQEGHDVASHAYRWIEYHDFSVEREKEYIKLAVASLKSLTGYAPRGYGVLEYIGVWLLNLRQMVLWTTKCSIQGLSSRSL